MATTVYLPLERGSAERRAQYESLNTDGRLGWCVSEIEQLLKSVDLAFDGGTPDHLARYVQRVAAARGIPVPAVTRWLEARDGE